MDGRWVQGAQQNFTWWGIELRDLLLVNTVVTSMDGFDRQIPGG